MNETSKAILDYIIEHKHSSDGNSPSIRTIGQSIGLPKSTVKYNLMKLETEGHISMVDGKIIVQGGLWLKLSSDLQSAIEGAEL